MSTTTSAEETQGAEPFGWAVSGCHGLFKGEHAEQDAKAEAKRCGGTTKAFALFTHPTPPPADHIGDATKLAGERAALITQHRARAESAKLRGPNYSPCISADELLELLDILAADALLEAKAWHRGRDAGIAEVARVNAQQVAVPQGWKPMPTEPTKAMWKAAGDAVVTLQQTSTLHHDKISDAVYRAMLAAAPQPPHGACDSPELCKLNGECAGQYGTKQKCTDSPTPPRAERVPMTPEQISDTYKKTTGQHLRPCDKHAVETLTREIEAHHEIGVKP